MRSVAMGEDRTPELGRHGKSLVFEPQRQVHHVLVRGPRIAAIVGIRILLLPASLVLLLEQP